MNISIKYKIYIITLFFGVLYFVYSIMISTYDFINIKHEQWVNAENQSTVYSSRRSTTVTYNFVKDHVRISRKYPGILEGINTWMWGIDKKARIQNISFYIRGKDEQRIKYHQIHHRKDILGNKLNEMEAVPFFGLRTINSNASTFLLILDIWKYNYSVLVAFIVLISPYFIFFVRKKILKKEVEKNPNNEMEQKIGGYQILFFILLVINLIV